jgi:transposase
MPSQKCRTDQFFKMGTVGGDSWRRFVAARRQNAANRRREATPTTKTDRPCSKIVKARFFRYRTMRHGSHQRTIGDASSRLSPDATETGQERRPPRKPRDVLNGILWILRTGAPWKNLPERYPPCLQFPRHAPTRTHCHTTLAFLRPLLATNPLSRAQPFTPSSPDDAKRKRTSQTSWPPTTPMCPALARCRRRPRCRRRQQHPGQADRRSRKTHPDRLD